MSETETTVETGEAIPNTPSLEDKVRVAHEAALEAARTSVRAEGAFVNARRTLAKTVAHVVWAAFTKQQLDQFRGKGDKSDVPQDIFDAMEANGLKIPPFRHGNNPFRGLYDYYALSARVDHKEVKQTSKSLGSRLEMLGKPIKGEPMEYRQSDMDSDMQAQGWEGDSVQDYSDNDMTDTARATLASRYARYVLAAVDMDDQARIAAGETSVFDLSQAQMDRVYKTWLKKNADMSLARQTETGKATGGSATNGATNGTGTTTTPRKKAETTALPDENALDEIKRRMRDGFTSGDAEDADTDEGEDVPIEARTAGTDTDTQTQPEQTQPEQTQPEQTQPEQTQPETQPEVPEASQPVRPHVPVNPVGIDSEFVVKHVRPVVDIAEATYEQMMDTLTRRFGDRAQSVIETVAPLAGYEIASDQPTTPLEGEIILPTARRLVPRGTTKAFEKPMQTGEVIKAAKAQKLPAHGYLQYRIENGKLFFEGFDGEVVVEPQPAE